MVARAGEQVSGPAATKESCPTTKTSKGSRPIGWRYNYPYDPPLALAAGGKGADRVHRAVRVDGKRLQEQWYMGPPLANDTRGIDFSAH
jgi:hypothetical protein